MDARTTPKILAGLDIFLQTIELLTKHAMKDFGAVTRSLPRLDGVLGRRPAGAADDEDEQVRFSSALDHGSRKF